MPIPIYTVDAFTAAPFAGNPAAVCLLPAARDDAWLRGVAAEMNLSETAFLLRRDDGSYDLRWLTPKVEVDLCGHATLASAHVLWETKALLPHDQARFHTRSGLLTADMGHGGWIELNFPAKPEQPAEPPDTMKRALDVPLLYTGRNAFDYIVLVESERVLRQLSPDFRLLRTAGVRGVIVTAPSDRPEYDFVSRFFAPGAGIDEDPVTGSAHCCLGPFWAGRMGKTSFTAFQASPRGGVVRVTCAANGRVLLGGQAVTTLRGELVA